jgi:hypothetical protein
MTNAFRVAAAAILLIHLSSPASAQSSDEKKRRAEWRDSLATNPLPKQGCFQSSYPGKQWREVPCVAAPNYPQQEQQQFSAEEGMLHGVVSEQSVARSGVRRRPRLSAISEARPEADDGGQRQRRVAAGAERDDFDGDWLVRQRLRRYH